MSNDKIEAAIQFYTEMIAGCEKMIKGYCVNFPNLKGKYEHQILIYKKCITRLKERMKK